MSLERKPDLHLEVAHVLFMDVVGFSKLLINDQSEILEQLNQLVRGTPHFREAEAAGKLIRLATGDGMALVFSNSAEAPVECALEISKALKSCPQIQLRMGIHSGPVNAVSDVNDRSNVTGAGINMAQRVMDCGDAGHILLSRHVAEDLEQYRQWQPCLHDLGDCEVKHGARVHVFNLYTDGVGNPEVPEKLQQAKAKEQTLPAGAAPAAAATSAKFAGPSRAWIAALVIGAAAIAVAGFYIFSHRSNSKAIFEKSIAVLPFENLSRDPDNAYFTDGIQDEILTRLSKIADLKVVSRTSTQQYQSKPGNLSEIAKQLGVAHILEGSVQKAGNAVHINVQLIKAATDAHLWGESYDRELQNIFGVEGEVAKAIADQLRVHLTGREEQVIAAKPTDNTEAYDAYLRGLAYTGELRWWLGWAQEVDGDHAAAKESWRQAETELESFLKEQPDNLALIGDMALTSVALGDKAAALALAQRAVATSPLEKDALDGSAALEFLARVLAQTGEPDRAITAIQKLLSIPSGGALSSQVPLTPALLRLDPMFDPLRNHPRFEKLASAAPTAADK
jgi:TolB-like protein/class 3 adenylate cyclase